MELHLERNFVGDAGAKEVARGLPTELTTPLSATSDQMLRTTWSSLLSSKIEQERKLSELIDRDQRHKQGRESLRQLAFQLETCDDEAEAARIAEKEREARASLVAPVAEDVKMYVTARNKVQAEIVELKGVEAAL